MNEMATPTTTIGPQDRQRALLDSLDSAGILLVEWENSLFVRLGCASEADESLFFLVPDHQLHQVRPLAADVGLFPAANEDMHISTCEYCPLALRFALDDPTTPEHWHGPSYRLVFAPFSWAGITPADVIPITSATAKVHHGRITFTHRIITVPSYVQTVPLSVACTALVRILARSSRGSMVRESAIECLASVVEYALFDMSEEDYEGYYDHVEVEKKEKKEIEDAAKEMEGWEMREGEEWIRSELIACVRKEQSYWDLPSQEDGPQCAAM